MVLGIKFKCNLIQYNKLPKDILDFRYGLNLRYQKGYGFVRGGHPGVGCEKEVQYDEAKAILDHVSKFGLKGEMSEV